MNMADRKYFFLIAVLGLLLMTQLTTASEENQDEDDDEACFKILAPICAKRQGKYKTFNSECEFKAENKHAKPPYKFVDDGPCASDPIIMD